MSHVGFVNPFGSRDVYNIDQGCKPLRERFAVLSQNLLGVTGYRKFIGTLELKKLDYLLIKKKCKDSRNPNKPKYNYVKYAYYRKPERYTKINYNDNVYNF